MNDELISTNTSHTAALQWLLVALNEVDIVPDTPVEIFIRVQGKGDRTLKVTLENSSEMREILRLTIGA